MKSPKVGSTRLQLPLGVAGSEPSTAEVGTLAFDTAHNKVRVKTSVGWADVGGGSSLTGVAAGSGVEVSSGSGPVPTVALSAATIAALATLSTDMLTMQAHAANTSNPHAVTKAQVGLNNVTNIKQLVEDFSSYPLDTTPSVGDLILTNDHAAGYAVRQGLIGDIAPGGDVSGTLADVHVDAIHETSGPTKLTIGAVPDLSFLRRSGSSLVGTAVVPIMTGNPYIDPPATPNAFDDEFEGGSADLAVRGWTVKNAAGTTLTRSGDVVPWDNVGPAAGNYRSTIYGSFIQVQFPVAATTYSIFKAVTLASGDIYFARFGQATRQDGTSVGQYLEVGLYANAAGIPDANNRVYVTTSQSASGGNQIDMFRATAGAFAGTNKAPLGANLPDIRGVRWFSGTTFFPFGVNSANGETTTTVPVGCINGSTVAWMGLLFGPIAANAGNLPWTINIDFVRKVTGAVGNVAQTPRPVYGGTAGGDLSGSLPNPNVAAIHETSGPTKLTIGAVADGQSLVRSGSTLIGATATRPMSAYAPAPSSALAFNDEFLSGSSDLATRGWTVTDSGGVTVITRSGDIVVWSAASGTGFASYPAGGTYRSTLVPGGMLIQPAAGLELRVYKAIPSTTGTLYTAFQLSASQNPSGTSTNMPNGYAAIAGATAGHWNEASKAFMGGSVLGNGADISHLWGTSGSSATGTVPGSTNTVFGPFVRSHGSGGNYIVGYRSGENMPFILNRNNAGNPDMFNGGPNPPAYAGIQVGSNSSGFTRTPNLVSVSYIRFVSGDTWIAS